MPRCLISRRSLVICLNATSIHWLKAQARSQAGPAIYKISQEDFRIVMRLSLDLGHGHVGALCVQNENIFIALEEPVGVAWLAVT